MKSDEVKELTEQELCRLIKNSWKETDELTTQNSSLSALEAVGLKIKAPIPAKDIRSVMLEPFIDGKNIVTEEQAMAHLESMSDLVKNDKYKKTNNELCDEDKIEEALRRFFDGADSIDSAPTSLSTTKNLGTITKPPISDRNISSVEKEHLAIFSSLGTIIKGSYKGKDIPARPSHRGFFGRISQLLDTLGSTVGQTLDALEAAQIEAQKNLYGRDSVEGLSREERVNLIIKKWEKDK